MVKLDKPEPESKQEDLSIFDEPEEKEPIDYSKAPAPKDYIDNYDKEATGNELFGKPDETELTREDKDFFGDWDNDEQEEEAFKGFLEQPSKVPELGESISQAYVARLLVEDGGLVQKDQDIMEFETDKLSQTITSECAGTVSYTHLTLPTKA